MNIRFSGFGGQGIVLSGFIMGNAAINEGKNAIQNQSYGSESRGGACRSDVIISDKTINELSPPEVDVLVSMSHSAFEKYLPMLKKGGTLIIDSDLVFPEDVKKFQQPISHIRSSEER
jgi:2-oxoglutarate ferredoxin oxidoreductase subunit gamma